MCYLNPWIIINLFYVECCPWIFVRVVFHNIFLSYTAERCVGSLVIEQDGQALYVAPLEEDGSVEIPGPYGATRIEIAAGRVRVKEASCPQRLCVAMGAIGNAGELVACVPNRLIVRVSGEGNGPGYDFLSQ